MTLHEQLTLATDFRGLRKINELKFTIFREKLKSYSIDCLSKEELLFSQNAISDILLIILKDFVN